MRRWLTALADRWDAWLDDDGWLVLVRWAALLVASGAIAVLLAIEAAPPPAPTTTCVCRCAP